jgi:hypothetical protein
MMADPSEARVAADLEESEFLSGSGADHWRVIRFAFPFLDFMIAAGKGGDGKVIEYGFQAELSKYPGQAPMVRIWDHAAKAPLAADKRPKGTPRIDRTFQVWGSDTIYRPWERLTGPHASNAASLDHLAWRPERRLSFIFRDLHGILNSNARADRVRAGA